jgi:serine/threonine protein kinase
MAAVYEASDAAGKRVAVKVLLALLASEHAAELAARFAREARVAAAIDSAHLVPVIDAGVDALLGLPFVVMPLLCGFDLEDLFERCGALHPTVAVRIASQACRGLAAAHESGVIHRDIKPGNVFLEHRRDGSVVVRVLDFGMAKLAGSETNITREGSVLGTPHYMAPEQARDSKSVDARADVWGLGACLYRALSGVPPYDTVRRFSDVLLALSTQPIDPVQERAPWVDGGLATVVHGALIRDVAARCPSARAFEHALHAFAGGSDGITADMLVPVPQEVAERAARRAAAPSSWEPAAPDGPEPPLAPSRPDALLGTTIAGYTVERSLGGARYEVCDGDGNRAAIEVLPRAHSPEVDRQLALIQGVRHPNVASLGGVVASATGERYLVRELVHGTTLARVIDHVGATEPHAAVALAVQAARGLGALHAAGVCHGRVRPEALFLAEGPDGSVTVQLTGFGCLEPAYGEATVADLCHLAPEQARAGGGADDWTDLYGLGATLFHAVSGRPPVTAGDKGELLAAVAAGAIPHLQDVAPWIKRELAEVIHGAIAGDRDARPDDADELADALAAQTLLSHVRLRDLTPVPSDMRGRIEDRASSVVTRPPSNPPPAPPRQPLAAPSAAAGPTRGAAWWAVVVVLLLLGALAAYLVR